MGVLGSMFSEKQDAAAMNPKSRDTRVLSTILLLRQAHAEVYGAIPLHIVGENELDGTSSLASKKEAGKEKFFPDFINTQAIYARVLCQAVAYPVMMSAIYQLFLEA